VGLVCVRLLTTAAKKGLLVAGGGKVMTLAKPESALMTSGASRPLAAGNGHREAAALGGRVWSKAEGPQQSGSGVRLGRRGREGEHCWE